MIRASNEFKYMLKNTLQKTRQMIENEFERFLNSFERLLFGISEHLNLSIFPTGSRERRRGLKMKLKKMLKTFLSDTNIALADVDDPVRENGYYAKHFPSVFRGIKAIGTAIELREMVNSGEFPQPDCDKKWSVKLLKKEGII